MSMWHNNTERPDGSNRQIMFYAGGSSFAYLGWYSKGTNMIGDWKLEHVQKWAYVDEIDINRSKADSTLLERIGFITLTNLGLPNEPLAPIYIKASEIVCISSGARGTFVHVLKEPFCVQESPAEIQRLIDSVRPIVEAGFDN